MFRIAYCDRTSVDRYVYLMKNEKGEEAESVQRKLAELIERAMTLTEGDLCEYAETLVEKTNYFEAALYFQIALTNFKQRANKVRAFRLSLDCIHGFGICIYRLHLAKPSRKDFLQTYLLPWMGKSMELTKQTNENNKIIALSMSLFFLFLGIINLNMEGLKLAENNFKVAMHVLEVVYGKEANIVAGYSFCQFHIGIICIKDSSRDRKGEGQVYMKRAMASIEKAQDLDALGKVKMLQNFRKNVMKIFF